MTHRVKSKRKSCPRSTKSPPVKPPLAFFLLIPQNTAVACANPTGLQESWAVRAYDPNTDAPFVLASWYRSARDRDIPQPLARRLQDLQVHNVLARATLLVLADPQDLNTLTGWVAYEPPAKIHWLYVPRPLRRLGIASYLLSLANPQGVVTASQRSRNDLWIRQALRRRGLQYVYEPL